MIPSRSRAGTPFSRRRLALCLWVFCGFFLAISYRAFDLQFLNTGKAFEHAKKQQIGYMTLKSKRGGIFDSTGALIASSKPSYSSYLTPADIADPEDFSREVAEISGLDYDFVLKRAQRKKRSFVWLERKMSSEVADMLKAAELKGLSFIKEQKRVYPQGYMLGPVVGFADTDLRGIEGLEYALDRYLAGRDSRIRLKRDGKGGSMLFHAPNVRERTSGADVFLTIDSGIQYVVEDELKKGVEKSSAESASAVLMDPHTGRILAMASYPFFDPNSFGSYTQIESRNLPVWRAFEPGSIMKPFLVSAAIEEKLVNERTVFDCEKGTRRIGNTEIHDSSPHGDLTVTETIIFSSNICASKIAELMGAPLYHRYLRKFGFGSKSGTLIPGEHRGILPAPKNWGRVGLATISFGQGVSVNTLQMAAAVSAIANGGYLMNPYIVDRVVDTSGNLLLVKNPKVEGKVISYDAARKVSDMMRQTVERGTGRRAKIPGYAVAGKTGTAQVPKVRGRGYMEGVYVVSFLGFAPVENPRMALAVIVHKPRRGKSGSSVAAPIFKAIVKRTLGIVETQTASARPDLPVSMPNLRGRSLRDVATWAEKAGVDLRVSGSGYAVRQTPRPGTLIKKGEKCSVSFEGGGV